MAIEDVQTLLEQGITDANALPQDYLERGRIVRPNSKEGKAFQAEMEVMLKHVLPDFDITKRPILFLLSDHERSEAGYNNGYIIPSDYSSIICLDRALIRSFKNYNQLAYVLLHEMTHLKLHDIFGEGANSQGEEAACDIRPLIKMAEAGLVMDEAKRLMMDWSRPKELPSWLAMFDVHPLPWYRVDIMETALGILRSTRGTLGSSEGKAILPLQEAFSAKPSSTLSRAQHTSFVKHTLTAMDYDDQSPLQKLETLEKILDECKYESWRLSDWRKALLRVPVDIEDKTQIAVLDRIANSVLDDPYLFNSLYLVLEEKRRGQSKKYGYPTGRIRELARSIKDFTNAQTPSEVDKKAKAVTANMEALPWIEIDWRNVNLPYFKMESKEYYREALRATTGDVTLPWEDHVKWACDLKSSAAIRTLWSLGVIDPRLLRAASDEDLTWFTDTLKQNFLSKPKDSRVTQCNLDSVILDRNGHVIGITDLTSVKETAYLNYRNTALGNEREEREKHAERYREGNMPSSGTESALLTALQVKVQEYIACLMQHQHSYNNITGFTEVKKLAHNLCTLFNQALSAQDPYYDEYRQFIRSFCLERICSDVTGTPVSEPILRKASSVQELFLFVATDQYKLFSLEEKNDILGHRNDLPKDNTFWRKSLDYKAPKTLDEMLVVLNMLEPLSYEGKTTIEKVFTRELAEFLVKRAKPDDPLWKLMIHHSDILEVVSGHHREEDDSTVLVKAEKKLRDYITLNKKWPEDVVSQSKIYDFLARTHLFPNHSVRITFVDRLIKTASSLPTVEDRIAAAETILFEGKGVEDADLRTQAIHLWVSSCKEKYGLDDNTPNYLQAMQQLLKRVKPVNAGLRYEMLRQLADAVISQRALSHEFEKTVYGETDRTSFTSSDMAAGIAQVLIDNLSEGKHDRIAAIKFLASKGEPENIEAFATQCQSCLTYYIRDFIFAGNATTEDTIQYVKDDRLKAMIKTEAQKLYENFWTAPMIARTAIMKQLMLPPKERARDRERGTDDTFALATETVIEELLPTTRLSFVKDHSDAVQEIKRDTVPYAEEARELLRAFLAEGVLDENQRPIFLSSLLAAVQRTRGAGTDIRVGQRLATLLEIMGPAWKKLGQAIASHPDTPRDIAEDMEPLKGKGELPRWQMWALYDHTVPKKLRDQYPTLGAVLGSASFFTAVDAGDSVFSLQTPYAKERAEDGFGIMEKYVQELKSGKYNLGNALPDSIADMVTSARHSAVLETNHHIGAAQAATMAQRYNGAVVEVDKNHYMFETAQWYNYGPEFRHMKKMPGQIFNDFAKEATTPQQAQAVHDAAKAVGGLELCYNLDAGPQDPDRHGRNFVIDGHHIGLFDHGAVHAVIKDREGKIVTTDQIDKALSEGGNIEIYTPSAQERSTLGNAMVATFKALREGKPLAVSMHEQIETVRRQKLNPDHLIRIERGLLAQQDCYRHYDKEGGDITDIFAGIYKGDGKNSYIHPEIRTILEEGAAKAMGAFGSTIGGAALLNMYFSKHAKNPIRIHLPKHIAVPTPKLWDMPKNTQDVPSLCTVEEVTTKGPKPPRPRKKPFVSDGVHDPMCFAADFSPSASYADQRTLSKLLSGRTLH